MTIKPCVREIKMGRMNRGVYEKRVCDLSGVVRLFSLFTESMCKSVRDDHKECAQCPFFMLMWKKSGSVRDRSYKCAARDMHAFVEKQYNGLYRPKNDPV